MFTLHEYAGFDGETLRYALLRNNEPLPGISRPLLFIAGMGGSVKGALDFLTPLLSCFDPIYGFDLRGFGINLMDPDKTSIPDIQADLAIFQKEILFKNHDILPAIAGISLGGALATVEVVKCPRNYQHLLLLAPAFKGHQAAFPFSFLLRILSGRLLKGRSYRTKLSYGVEALTRNPKCLNDPLYRDTVLEFSVDFLLQTKFFTEKAGKLASRISIPTLMIVPGQDTVCCPKTMKEVFETISPSVPKTLKEFPMLLHDVLLEEESVEISKFYQEWSLQQEMRS